MRSRTIPCISLLAPLALAACSEEPGNDQAGRAAPTPYAIAGAGGESLAPGQKQSSLALLPLAAADREAQPLAGELGCDFSVEREVLLVAMGNVADTAGRAEALAKIDAGPVRLVARDTGGFDGLPDGGAFSGEGISAVVSCVSDARPRGGESPPCSAELIVRRGDGAEHRVAGQWTCGP